MLFEGLIAPPSNRSGRNPYSDGSEIIADSFVKLQQARHTADYDNSKVWSRTQVWETIAQAEDAIAAWSKIREDAMAQDYLLDLISPRTGRATQI